MARGSGLWRLNICSKFKYDIEMPPSGIAFSTRFLSSRVSLPQLVRLENSVTWV